MHRFKHIYIVSHNWTKLRIPSNVFVYQIAVMLEGGGEGQSGGSAPYCWNCRRNWGSFDKKKAAKKRQFWNVLFGRFYFSNVLFHAWQSLAITVMTTNIFSCKFCHFWRKLFFCASFWMLITQKLEIWYMIFLSFRHIVLLCKDGNSWGGGGSAYPKLGKILTPLCTYMYKCIYIHTHIYVYTYIPSKKTYA